MALIQVVPASPSQSVPDAQPQPLLGGKFGEAIVAELHGKHFTQAYRGNVYNLSSAVAGVAVPISTTTAPNFGIWNRAGNTKLCVPLLYIAAYVSGTSVATNVGLSYVSNAGAAIATGGAFTAVTTQTPLNVFLAGGNVSQMTGFSAGTLTTAGTWLQTLGIVEYAAIATSAITGSMAVYDFHGSLIVPPNVAFFTTGPAATGALLAQTLIYEEVPL